LLYWQKAMILMVLVSQRARIDEFVRTAGTESAWQIVALDDLKHEITDRGWGTTCSGYMLDYIAQQRAAIAAKCEPL
jgi:hypothetical protein